MSFKRSLRLRMSDCLSVSLLVFLTVLMSVSLSLCVSLCVSFCLPANTPLAKDLINVARNVAETANMSEKHHQTVGTYFEQLFHLLAGHLSPPLPLMLVLLLLLLLVLVLHSFVYWHFVMCCKWQPRHMNNGTRATVSGRQLASATAACWSISILKPLANCWHPWPPILNPRPALLVPVQSGKHARLVTPGTIAIDSNCIWNWNSKSLDHSYSVPRSCLAISQCQINWLQYLWLMTLADCVFNHLLTKLLKQLNESLPNAYAGSQLDSCPSSGLAWPRLLLLALACSESLLLLSV